MTFYLKQTADGYYVGDEWHMEQEWESSAPNPYSIINRTDSRGDYSFATGFIVAFGKTFKSGKLNVPVNIYIAPKKEGARCGVSFGFNARKVKI